ncbi:uncharacterized protein LOC108632236 [Ceratina calcarata]|uniref:Uncharacterized protein LOC108632236 n=1 Tax=Ceratina calcarata TaxID=156304 RepID=A0AAJ7JGF3_9HYME|nr:uncharacterized protein LOC108632236 [Ceratina calcarata]
MRSSLVLLVSIVASAAAAPLEDPQNGRLFAWNTSEFPVSTEAEIVTDKEAASHSAKKQSETSDGGTTDSSLPSVTTHDYDRAETTDDALQAKMQESKATKKSRKHKAIVLDYLSKLPFSNVLPYDVNYNNYDTEGRKTSTLHRHPDSNIFYVRLPPTPYMFVPGLGYISQPPKYSTSSLRPQFGIYAKPKPSGTDKQTVQKPFIKVPIDFVSNGKPTSVYQWQKKKNKKPADSPITNLDGLSADFNGKPSTIYQWQGAVKPVKKTDDLVNILDKGPYYFSGKPTSVYVLNPDGTSKLHQRIRYQRDNSYY